MRPRNRTAYRPSYNKKVIKKTPASIIIDEKVNKNTPIEKGETVKSNSNVKKIKKVTCGKRKEKTCKAVPEYCEWSDNKCIPIKINKPPPVGLGDGLT